MERLVDGEGAVEVESRGSRSIRTCWGGILSIVNKCSDDTNNNFPLYRRLLLIVSFCFYVIDVGLDAWVAAEYYIADKQGTDSYAKYYLTATLIFIIVPCLILNIVSWALYTWGWLLYHNKRMKWFCTRRGKCLNYVEKDGLVEQDELEETDGGSRSFPTRGVYIVSWPRPSDDSTRQISGRVVYEMRGISNDRDKGKMSTSEFEETDAGLEFYPLDLLDLSEYIVVTILHVLLLGYLFRILRLIYVSSRKDDRDAFNFDRYRDISFLRLVESFLEAAPQVVLQLYLLVVHTEAVLWYRVVTPISILFSITSLALSVGDYFSAAQDIDYYDPPPPHQKRQKRLSWSAYIGVIVWHFLMIVSRALSIALFATVYGSYIFLVIGIHYVAMVYWMYWQQARVFKRDEGDFNDEKRCNCKDKFISWRILTFPIKQLCDNYGIEFIVAAFNVFFHFKIRDGESQFTLIPFYLLTFVENTLMILLWYFGRDYSSPTWYAIPALVTVFVTFFIGIAIMVLYYWFGVPKGILVRAQPLDHPVMTSTLNRMYSQKIARGNFFKRIFGKRV